MFCIPLIALAPLQPPEALQELVLVLDQFRELELPAVMVSDDALRDTAGVAGAVPLPLLSL